jgi:hypothetical protein
MLLQKQEAMSSACCSLALRQEFVEKGAQELKTIRSSEEAGFVAK